MDDRVRRILEFLNHARVRATYAAVGEALGDIPARAVGTMLGDRRPEASWVVNADTVEPSGYQPDEIHPDLRQTDRILKTGMEVLRAIAGLDPRVTDEIEIPTIRLAWSDWTAWRSVEADARSGEGALVPNKQPGVYEVKGIDEEERLTIGRASDLRMRVKQGLVRGKAEHSSGDRIRDEEDLSRLVIRWAVTDRPAAVEEELHRRYRKRFGHLPKHVQHT